MKQGSRFHEKPARRGTRLKTKAHAGSAHNGHQKHSPFFLLWELATLSCVMLIGMNLLLVPLFSFSETTHHQIEVAARAAELILIAEVTLLILVARDKIKFVFKNWLTILAVLPFGGAHGLKIAWHAFEKTRVGNFLRHPITSIRRYAHIKLGLRV